MITSRLRALYTLRPIQNVATAKLKQALARAGVCFSGLLGPGGGHGDNAASISAAAALAAGAASSSSSSLHLSDLLGPASATQEGEEEAAADLFAAVAGWRAVLSLWERNVHLCQQLFSNYALALEPIAPGPAAAEASLWEAQGARPSPLAPWSSWAFAEAGQAVRSLSFEQLKALLTDFGIFPHLLDLQSLYRTFRSVKLWEWSLGDAVMPSTYAPDEGADSIDGLATYTLFRPTRPGSPDHSVSGSAVRDLPTRSPYAAHMHAHATPPPSPSAAQAAKDPLGVAAARKSLNLSLAYVFCSDL